MKNWYIFRCRPGFEIKAADELARNGVGSYCPQVRKRIKRHKADGAGHDVWRPLFVGYVMAEAAQSALSGLCELEYINRVITYGGTDTPAIIPDVLVLAIKVREEAERIKFDKTLDRKRPKLKPGDIVEVQTGGWGKVSGKIMTLDNKGAIRLLVRLLGSEREIKIAPETPVELQSAE